MRTLWLGQATQGSAARPITDAEFDSVVLSAPKAVALFYSPNCPYSRSFLPIWESLAAANTGIVFAQLNVDQSVQNAGKYNINTLPTVIFFENGKEVGRIDGVQQAADFNAEMGKAFSTGAPAYVPPANYEREGTTLEKKPIPVGTYVVGGVAAAGLLSLLGYLAFGK